MSTIKKVKLRDGGSSAKSRREENQPEIDPVRCEDLGGIKFKGRDLGDLLQAVGRDLEGAEIEAWIALAALGLLSFPTGQIKYTAEKEIADLLGVEEDVLINTIEKAQAKRKVMVVDKTIVPCKTKWVNDPNVPRKKNLVYDPCKSRFWARYKGLIFLEKLFPGNKELNPERLPNYIQIPKRLPVRMRKYICLYPSEQENADRDYFEEIDRGLSLWKEDRDDLRRRLQPITAFLKERCQKRYSPERNMERV